MSEAAVRPEGVGLPVDFNDSAQRAAARACPSLTSGSQWGEIRAQQSAKYGTWLTDLGQSAGDDVSGPQFQLLWRMLREGEPVDTIGGYGETALLRTQGEGLWTPLLLLRYGADPNMRCEMWDALYGGTALHQAATGGNVALVRLLLSAGANPALLDKAGCTAAQAASTEAARRLALANDPNPHITYDGSGAAQAAIMAFVASAQGRVDIHAGSLCEAHAALTA